MSCPGVFVVGDSISMHYGPFLQQYLQGMFTYNRKGGIESTLQDLEIPADANGGDSTTVLLYLQCLARARGFKADVLLLNCGLHDIKTDPATGAKQVPLPRYRQNLEQLIPVARSLKCELVWMRTTPADERVHNVRSTGFHRFAQDVHDYNAAADAVMTAAKVPIVDLHTFTVNLGPELFCDHVHFVEPVREKQAAFLAGWLCARYGVCQ